MSRTSFARNCRYVTYVVLPPIISSLFYVKFCKGKYLKILGEQKKKHIFKCLKDPLRTKHIKYVTFKRLPSL